MLQIPTDDGVDVFVNPHHVMAVLGHESNSYSTVRMANGDGFTAAGSASQIASLVKEAIEVDEFVLRRMCF